MLDMEILVHGCKTHVSVTIPNEWCLVFSKAGSLKDPPMVTIRNPGVNAHLDTPDAKSRWERLTRREASDWVRRAQEYIKKQEKKPCTVTAPA